MSNIKVSKEYVIYEIERLQLNQYLIGLLINKVTTTHFPLDLFRILARFV